MYSTNTAPGHVTLNLCCCMGGVGVGRGEFAGHVVCSGASGPRNVHALFVMLWWHWYGLYKKRAGPH
jgi:hypothetical protein